MSARTASHAFTPHTHSHRSLPLPTGAPLSRGPHQSSHSHGHSTHARTKHADFPHPQAQPTPLSTPLSTPFSRRYRALSSSIEKDGFKSALLLRLAPVLPIPIDAHWYVAGCTPLKLPTFFCAYFVGALKVRPEFDHRSISGTVAAGREGGVRPAH